MLELVKTPNVDHRVGTAYPRGALSERELECMRWVAAGKTDREIGTILAISTSTARFHMENVRSKLDASTRAHAVAILFARGLLWFDRDDTERAVSRTES